MEILNNIGRGVWWLIVAVFKVIVFIVKVYLLIAWTLLKIVLVIFTLGMIGWIVN